MASTNSIACSCAGGEFQIVLTGPGAFPPAIFLMGPTASGKTDLAVDLVQRFPCDIISVDSALVYRGMDIGTAKPDAQTQRIAPHRLIDICEPEDPYSAARFRDDALREMEEITARGRVPLLVGGTMLYFRALEKGLSELPPADADVRAALAREADLLGWPALHARLAAVDPQSAARIKPTDSQRIQRALEVHELTGQPMGELLGQSAAQPFPWSVTRLAVTPADREVLHERIARRFEAMLEQGFVEEVRGLLARHSLDPELPSMRAVGYRQVRQYLEGDLSADEMVERGVIATRQLAKRQLTWLRGETGIEWIDTLDADAVHKVTKRVGTALDEG